MLQNSINIGGAVATGVANAVRCMMLADLELFDSTAAALPVAVESNNSGWTGMVG